jgi:hypothetical protein
MHLLPSVAKQPNLELKTRPKQLPGSLPLVIALPAENTSSLSHLKIKRFQCLLLPLLCLNMFKETI